MTPRERILRTFRREVPDRIPADAIFHPEVEAKLKVHYGTRDWNVVLAELGIEGWVKLRLEIDFPGFAERATCRPGGKPGEVAVWHDDRTWEDGWGVVHRLGADGRYKEWVYGPLMDAVLADVETYPFPTPNQVVEPVDLAGTLAAQKADGLFITGAIPNPYKRAWLLRGMDNVLCDYLIDPALLGALYDPLYALYSDMAVRMARAGVDMIEVNGDFAMQDRIIMGPDAWRREDKPRMADVIRRCKAVNPDLHFFVHSDGNVMDLMDDLVEIGFDVINPVQPECMDPAEVKRRWGDRVAIHGGISIQRTLPFGTPDDVRAEIEGLIRTCGPGGYVAFPSNVVQPDTPVENIIACFHAARDFDLAELQREDKP